MYPLFLHQDEICVINQNLDIRTKPSWRSAQEYFRSEYQNDKSSAVSPLRSSKWGSECFLPMSAKDRTSGIRFLRFFSLWWWWRLNMASLTFSRPSSSSWPDASMLSITMSACEERREVSGRTGTIEHISSLQPHAGSPGLISAVVELKTVNWFTWNLQRRNFWVTIRRFTSAQTNMTCGVPQGSISGPLSFQNSQIISTVKENEQNTTNTTNTLNTYKFMLNPEDFVVFPVNESC